MFLLKQFLLFLVLFKKDEAAGNLDNQQNISVMDLISGQSYAAIGSEAKSVETSVKNNSPLMIAPPDEFSAEEAALASNPSKRSLIGSQKRGKKAITTPNIAPLLLPKSNRLAGQSGRMFEPSLLAKKSSVQAIQGRTLDEDGDSDETERHASELKSKSKSSYVTVKKWSSSGNNGEDLSSEDSPLHLQFSNSTKSKDLFASSMLGPQLAKFKQNANNKVTINRYSSIGGNSSKTYKGKLENTNFGGVNIPNYNLNGEVEETDGGGGEDSNGMDNIPGFGKGKIISYKKTTKIFTSNFTGGGFKASQSKTKTKSPSPPPSPSQDKIMSGLNIRKTGPGGQGKPGGRSLFKLRKNYETPLKRRDENPTGNNPVPGLAFKPGGRALEDNKLEANVTELPRHAILASQTGRMLGASLLAPKPAESGPKGRSLMGAKVRTTQKPKHVAAKLPGAKKHDDLADESTEDMPKPVQKKPKNSLLAPSILPPKPHKKKVVE